MGFYRQFFSLRTSRNDEFLRDVEKLIGKKPKNRSLYKLALTHRSATKSKKVTENNERLEFLGDAVLSAVVAAFLYEQYPNENEGFLTGLRSKIVSRHNLNNVAKGLGINHLIESNLYPNRVAKSLLGDALEAFIGAVYLDLGTACAKNFIYKHILHGDIDVTQLEQRIKSSKSKLLEWAQKEKKHVHFEMITSWGQQHKKTFEMGVYAEGVLKAKGQGDTKKKAEEAAAAQFINNFFHGQED